MHVYVDRDTCRPVLVPFAAGGAGKTAGFPPKVSIKTQLPALVR